MKRASRSLYPMKRRLPPARIRMLLLQSTDNRPQQRRVVRQVQVQHARGTSLEPRCSDSSRRRW